MYNNIKNKRFHFNALREINFVRQCHTKLTNTTTHQQRYQDFTTNTTSMINSILDCYHEPAIFYNICTASKLIYEPTQIKQHIKDYYEQWTKHNPFDLTEWPNWQQEYQPNHISNNHSIKTSMT